jgi:hypothetical protein
MKLLTLNISRKIASAIPFEYEGSTITLSDKNPSVTLKMSEAEFEVLMTSFSSVLVFDILAGDDETPSDTLIEDTEILPPVDDELPVIAEPIVEEVAELEVIAPPVEEVEKVAPTSTEVSEKEEALPVKDIDDLSEEELDELTK